MKKYLIILTVLGCVLFLGIGYGILIHKNQVFPYKPFKMAYAYLKNENGDRSYGPWSIGIYTGASPFELLDPKDIPNPVLTGKDVTDIEAAFVADPFLIIEKDYFYLFFEVLNRETAQGDIGFAESEDGKQWEYKKIIIDEPFHLSYPYVFKWNDHYYLILESHNDLSIRLYQATSFPDEWQFLKRIFHGEHYVDPSIFRHDNIWWMFYTNPLNDALNLYYADELTGDWKPHPLNPIVKLNKHIARPGGRVLVHDGHLYRFAQDAEPRYGIQVFAFEVKELSKTTYKETLVSEKPVVTMSGEGWNAYGMHHIDLHALDGGWIAAVDGKCAPSSKIPCRSFSTKQ